MNRTRLSWQAQLAQAIRHPAELLEYVGLQTNAPGFSEKMINQFPLRVPHAFADRMQTGNPDDPLLRQVFPYLGEERGDRAFINDPLHEADTIPVAGLLQKYHGRVLSITTGTCAIHCRYCFRRHFPYHDAAMTAKKLYQSIDYIRADTSIKEVILSGGDPLILSDQHLLELCRVLAAIKHVKRIRFHSRIPVVLPARLSETLLTSLSRIGKPVLFVVHINHANEIDEAVSENIRLFWRFNIPVFNQSVLLKGVNDDCDTLINLSEALVENQIIPYYLHLLDPVAGAVHYDVPETIAKRLIKQMRARVGGYLVPRLVREETGQQAKTLIGEE